MAIDATEAAAIRRAIRSGIIDGHTSGRADGFVQGNAAILPAAQADEFVRFCRLNAPGCMLTTDRRHKAGRHDA